MTTGSKFKSQIKDHAFRNLFLADRRLGRLIGDNLTKIRRLLRTFWRIVFLKVYALSKRKMQKKASKYVWLINSAIKFVVKMHFKYAKEAAEKSDAVFLWFFFFLQVLFAKVKHMSCYDVTVHLRYDVTGQKLTDWPETLSRLAVTNTG